MLGLRLSWQMDVKRPPKSHCEDRRSEAIINWGQIPINMGAWPAYPD
jgi:hypothetical protein